jgi:hypothetical protein
MNTPIVQPDPPIPNPPASRRDLPQLINRLAASHSHIGRHTQTMQRFATTSAGPRVMAAAAKSRHDDERPTKLGAKFLERIYQIW